MLPSAFTHWLRGGLLTGLLAGQGFAQGALEEWAAFPPSAPDAGTREKPKAASAASRDAGRATTDAGASRPKDAGWVIVGSRERYLEGSEPQALSTIGRGTEDRMNLRHVAGTGGTVGFFKTASADLGAPGVVRLGATAEYFSARNFPVRDAVDTRTAGTFAVSLVPLSFLEVGLAYGAAANTNSRSSPTLIQALGDITLTGKLTRRWATGLYAGGELRLFSFPGVGNQDARSAAFGLSPRVLATFDARDHAPKVPLRAHANLGFSFDGTGGLVQAVRLNAAEEFALNVNRFNRFLFGLAVEAPLPWVTPFLEYGLALPVGVAGGRLVSPDGSTLALGQVLPQTVTLGARLTAIRAVTVTAGVDLGLTRAVGLGVPATPPYNLLLAASFQADVFARERTRSVETFWEKQVPVAPVAPVVAQAARLSGQVVDGRTGKPVGGALLQFDSPGSLPVASSLEDGRFLTHELPPTGKVTLKVARAGYRSLSQEVAADAGPLSLPLQPATVTKLTVKVRSKNGQPVFGDLLLSGPRERREALSSDRPLSLELPAGTYQLQVEADGFLAQRVEQQVAPEVESNVALELTPVPRRKLIVVRRDRIEILRPIRFANGQATILPESFPLLLQVVDVLLRDDDIRVKIEGHTDNRGNRAVNLKLSRDRASAVADFLAKAGVARARLSTEGYGDSRPVAPNMTSRGRDLNRRVDFLLLPPAQ